MSDIDEAIDRVIGGPAKKNKLISNKEKNMIAYHESGHAILGLKLPSAQTVQKVTIVPRGQAGGYVLMTPDHDRFLETKGELLDEITGLLGGRVSEEIFFDDITTGAHNDIEKATHIARLMVTELGMSNLGPIQYEKNSGSVFLGRDYANSHKAFSQEVGIEIDREVRRIIEECYDRARNIINENKETVHLIAQTLLVHETLTNEQIVHLVDKGCLPGECEEVKEEVVNTEEVANENIDEGASE
jgi:cell division protease FtsH